MKHLHLFVKLCLFVLFFHGSVVKADHIMAADIRYECLGGNDYRFTLTLYRSCSGIPAAPTQYLYITSQSCNYIEFIPFDSIGPGTEVSSICASQINNTDCSGGLYPGVQLYYYTKDYTMPMQCNDWVISWESCCRNYAISTGPSGQSMSVSAFLNNSAVQCNNSPSFSTLAVPYFCVGSPVNYSHATIELDGDSLVYELVSPMEFSGQTAIPGTAPTAVNFTLPYSTTYPIATSPANNVVFSTQTGLLNFTPALVQQGVMAVRVYEYRNGVLIGYVTRDIQIVIMNCNAGNITVINPISVTGAIQQLNDSSVFGICPNTLMSFSVEIGSSSSSLQVNSNNNITIPGSTVSFSGTNPMIATFSWTPPANASGSYSFTLAATDNSCPVYSNANANYIIRVLGIDILASQAILCPSATDTIQLNSYGGSSNGTYLWTGPGLISNNIANPIAIVSGTPATYSVTYIENGCVATNGYTVASLGTINAVPDSVTTCGGTIQLSANVNFVIPPPACDTSNLTCVGGSQNFAINNGTVNSYDPINWISYSPFGQQFGLGRNAYLYSAAQLTAAGLGVGLITGLSFNVLQKQTNLPFENLRIKMRCSQLDTLNPFGNFPGGLKEVYYNASFNTTLGWNTFAFDYPYYWDGVSNILIQVCFDNAFMSNVNDEIAGISNTGLNSMYSIGWTSGGCNEQYGSSGNYQPNIKLDFCSVSPAITYNWSPANLVSDPNIINPTCIGNTNMQLVLSATQQGCTIKDTVIVTIANPQFPFMPTQFCCKGDSVMLNPQMNGAAIMWYLNGSLIYQGDSLKVSPSTTTTYTLITNSTCGSDTQTVTVQVLPEIAFNATIVNASCAGNQGSIALNVINGSSPYTYLWNTVPPQTTANISGLAANTYHVTVTDLYGCVKDSNLVVSFDAGFTANISNITPPTCINGNNGSATVSVNPSNNITYLWNTIPPQNTATASNLSANTYIVTISNPLNPQCSTSLNVVIPQGTPIVALASELSPVSCKGGNDGQAQVTITGGTGQFNYSWTTTPPQTTPIMSNLVAGNYTVYVFEINDPTCFATTSTTITEPATNISVMLSAVQNASCFDWHNGTATAIATGGTGNNYSYQWRNENLQLIAGQAQATGLGEGYYFLSVKDVNNCEDTFSIYISQPPLLTVMIDSVKNSTCDLPNGSAMGFAAGGTPNYTYSWNSSPVQTTSQLSQASAGLYSLIVQDNNGCQADDQIFITTYSPPIAAFSSNPLPQDTIYDLGGIYFYNYSTGAYRYVWNFGDGHYDGEENTIHYFQDYGTFQVILTAYDIAGDCPTYDTLTYTFAPRGDLYIPSAFSPNEDSSNDYFIAKGYNITDFSLIIYDRWGIQIAQLNALTDSWDGKDAKTGKIMPEGVYTYIARAKNKMGQKMEKSGTITLLR